MQQIWFLYSSSSSSSSHLVHRAHLVTWHQMLRVCSLGWWPYQMHPRITPISHNRGSKISSETRGDICCCSSISVLLDWCRGYHCDTWRVELLGVVLLIETCFGEYIWWGKSLIRKTHVLIFTFWQNREEKEIFASQFWAQCVFLWFPFLCSAKWAKLFQTKRRNAGVRMSRWSEERDFLDQRTRIFPVKFEHFLKQIWCFCSYGQLHMNV